MHELDSQQSELRFVTEAPTSEETVSGIRIGSILTYKTFSSRIFGNSKEVQLMLNNLSLFSRLIVKP